MIGWANARVVEGVLDVQLGYVEREPTSRAFQRELEAEIARLEAFIVPRRP
jgi:hypothetical protein